MISFKNPQNPNLARRPPSIPPLNLHHMSCLHRLWHRRGSLHQPPIALPPSQCRLHPPQILHRHSLSQTLAPMSLPQTSAKPQPLFQIFHHTSKFHLNFTHNYETYLTTIRLSTLQTCQILNFPISLNSIFFSLQEFKWEKWLEMLKKTFNFWIFVSWAFSLDLARLSFKLWFDFLFGIYIVFQSFLYLKIWIWLFWIVMVFWFSSLTAR